MPVLKIVGLTEETPTSFDDQYLVEYDPTRQGVDPDGLPMSAHLVCTPHRDQARVFETSLDALETWRLQHGLRDDGEPNRPLTAFTVTIE